MPSLNTAFHTALAFSRLWNRGTAALVKATTTSQQHPRADNGEAQEEERQNQDNTEPMRSTESESDRLSHSGRQTSRHTETSRSYRREASRSNYSGSNGSSSSQTGPSQEHWWTNYIPFIGYHQVLMMLILIGVILLGENTCLLRRPMTSASDIAFSSFLTDPSLFNSYPSFGLRGGGPQ